MSSYPIFSVLGLEIEYMLVDKVTLNVQPKSDLILKALAGRQVNEVELDDIAISNELVMHVLEFKNNGPKPANASVADHFQKAIQDIQPVLDTHHVMLLPTGAHPWMNPHTETVRWPHDSKAIYEHYDAIFDCRGHGWSNLQSMHVNLPYANAVEFAQLHNVIRLILPLIPALAASTPILDGKPTGMLDSRLNFYAKNQQRIPEISGDIIPEFIKSQHEYEQRILKPMYEAIEPFDPQGILQHSWLNSRGAIPKFDYQAIEIRIVDSQECIDADLAIAHLICAVLKLWQSTSDYYLETPCDTMRLKAVYDQAIREGFSVSVDDMLLLDQWQLPKRTMTLKTIWTHLIEQVSSSLSMNQQTILEHILSRGCLSERILRANGPVLGRDSLKQVYTQLADCLLHNEAFIP